jgi:DNA-binding NtrC family response regulator
MDSGSRARRLLIVDDEHEILSSLQALLNAIEPSWEVDIAISGPEALKLTKAGQYDVVISDYRMPEMDGLTFLKQVRADSASLPLVLMTAFPDLQIAIDAINDIGIQNFFSKPLDPDEIVQVLRDIVTGNDRSSDRARAFARAMKLAGRDK